MSIPTAPDLMRPVLEEHRGGDALRLDDLVDRLAERLGVSNEERNQLQPSGDRVFAQRVGWARNYLEQLGFINRPSRGLSRLTNEGKDALESESAIPLPPADWAARPVSRDAVLGAIELFKKRGRDAVLTEHGFRGALNYVVDYEGETYDAKALYGVAYSIEYPDEEPIRNRGLQGGSAVNRKLEELGFQIRNIRNQTARDAQEETRVWIIRAGSEGESEALALAEGAAVIGWSDLGPLSLEASRDDIKEMIAETHVEERARSLDSQAGQIYRFIHEVRAGDLVVLPRKSDPSHVAVGWISGEYQHRDDGAFADSDAKNTRAVEWIAEAAPYDWFDSDLRTAFGAQGTISRITPPNAAARILSTLNNPKVVELVVKWSQQYGASTVEDHRAVEDTHGAVWWGLIGSHDRPKLAQKWVKRIRAQLDSGAMTRVYISGPTSWITELVDLTVATDEVDQELVPDYYSSEWEYGLWVKLRNFQPTDRTWLTEHLELVSAPGVPLSDGALSNQTNPLIVRADGTQPAGARRVWWVNQGTTYASSRDGSFLWAPTVDKAGNPRPSWDLLKEAVPGDQVLHYATGAIRAVGRVTDSTVEAARPEGMPDQEAWNSDGWLLGVQYRELATPIVLSSIPEQWRVTTTGPFTSTGSVQQGYFYALEEEFVSRLAERFPELGLEASSQPPQPSFMEPSFEAIVDYVRGEGLRIDDQTQRRYHLSLGTRGFVILSGWSGSGKTWLAELYAEAVGAERLLVAVAPNWTTNEDLLGYLDPLSNEYRHTPFSQFLEVAATDYASAQAEQRAARPFHLILDEMNLARVEYYFAKFLSAMEIRARRGTAALELAPGKEVLLTPNLRFIGTVNVDETTHGFADKVYDRAQLIEMPVPEAAIREHLGDAPYRDLVLDIWRAVRPVAPFAFRVLDELTSYQQAAAALGVSWTTAVDEQLLQKVLPKVKGTDPRLRETLERITELATSDLPLTHAKASVMLESFNTHGFVTFF